MNATKNYCARTGRACVGGAYDGADGWGIDCATTPDGCQYRVDPGQDGAQATEIPLVDLIVTRHPGLVEVLREQGLIPTQCVCMCGATCWGRLVEPGKPHPEGCGQIYVWEDACEVIAHATPAELRGKHVAGVLPLALAALTGGQQMSLAQEDGMDVWRVIIRRKIYGKS